MTDSKFEQLLAMDVNDKKETRGEGRNALDYLSWVFAWAEFKKVYPKGNYEIKKFKTFADDEKGMRLVPYMFDEKTGYMVNTEVDNGEGEKHEMWLPVMDSVNNALKSEPYTYKVKEYKDGRFTGQYIDKQVASATMFDVNKAIMRCLVKNIAMFGLGLYIYAGEDLPEKITTNSETVEEKEKSLSKIVIECKTEQELKAFYDEYKSVITKNKDLMDLVTRKGVELKRIAA